MFIQVIFILKIISEFGLIYSPACSLINLRLSTKNEAILYQISCTYPCSLFASQSVLSRLSIPSLDLQYAVIRRLKRMVVPTTYSLQCLGKNFNAFSKLKRRSAIPNIKLKITSQIVSQTFQKFICCLLMVRLFFISIFTLVVASHRLQRRHSNLSIVFLKSSKY